MHYLSITAIFKQENPWLVEWLEYHLQRGVEHFYLYNNDDDSTESDQLLAPYIARGLVDNIHVKGPGRQMPVFSHALENFSSMTHWMALIDLDEFILPRKHDDLRSLMEHYEEYAGLGVHWNIFGSSGYVKRPPNQIDYFLNRAENSHPANRNVKSIVKPRLVDHQHIPDPHHFRFHSGMTVDENRSPVECAVCDYTGNEIRINHYMTRSRQDTEEVKIPRGYPISNLTCDSNLFHVGDCNDVFDDEISRRFGQGAKQLP